MNIGQESEAFVAEPLEVPDTETVEQPEREEVGERVLVPVARDAEAVVA